MLVWAVQHVPFLWFHRSEKENACKATMWRGCFLFPNAPISEVTPLASGQNRGKMKLFLHIFICLEIGWTESFPSMETKQCGDTRGKCCLGFFPNKCNPHCWIHSHRTVQFAGIVWASFETFDCVKLFMEGVFTSWEVKTGKCHRSAGRLLKYPNTSVWGTHLPLLWPLQVPPFPS